MSAAKSGMAERVQCCSHVNLFLHLDSPCSQLGSSYGMEALKYKDILCGDCFPQNAHSKKFIIEDASFFMI